jgi:hypothetical protein
MAEPKAKS